MWILTCEFESGKRARTPQLEIQRGVQWKQGVVIHTMLYTILLHNTAPPRAVETGCSDSYDVMYYFIT